MNPSKSPGTEPTWVEDLRRLGVAEEDIKDAQGVISERTEIEGGLWESHLPAYQAFCAGDTQWRSASMGLAGSRFLGLDYTAVEVSLRQFNLKLDPPQWKQFREIEHNATYLRNGGKAEDLVLQVEREFQQ